MSEKMVTIKKKPFYKVVYGPLLIANLLANGITLAADLVAAIIAGNVLGEKAVAAVSLTSPLYILICFFGYIVSIGAPILYNQTYGKFELEHAYKIFGQSVVSATAIGIFSAVFLKWFSPHFYAFYGASEEITAMAQDYFKYFIIVALIYPIYVLLQNIVYQDGDSNLCIIAMVTQILVNIAVALILTAKIGIIGLGIGTVSGVSASASVLLIHFLKKTNSIRIRLGWEWHILSMSVKLGLYASVVYILSIVVSVSFNKFIITNFGEAFIPVYSTIGTLINLSLLFQSFITAATPLISVYYGEGNMNGIRRVMRSVIRQGVIAGVGFSLIAFTFAEIFPTIIGISTPEVFENAVRTVRLAAASFTGTAVFCIFEGYYSVMRKSILSLAVAVISANISPLVMSVIFMKRTGITGIGVGFSAGAVISVILIYLIVRLRFGKGAFPFLIKEKQENVRMFDLTVDNESIVETREKIADVLSGAGFAEDRAKRVEFIFEESFIRIKDENEGKKVTAEVTLIIGEELQMIIKDTGRIFDMTDIDCAVTSLNRYVLALSLENMDKKVYALTSGYNRNSFVFTREWLQRSQL